MTSERSTQWPIANPAAAVLGGMADQMVRRGATATARLRACMPDNPFRPPRTNRYWPPKYRARCPRGLSTSPGTPPLRKWMRKATRWCFVREPTTGCVSQVTRIEIGNVPMCADPMGLQWMRDIMAGKPAPTNTAPGIIYMLCGATQHSNTDPFDKSSPAIPIGPHWMIIWPYDAVRDGLPSTVRDAGAWVMFDGTPYAYLHICGTPWAGNEYTSGQVPIWTMRYGAPTEPPTAAASTTRK